MLSRVQSIKTKILLLVAVPLVALVSLWVFAVSVTLGDSLQVLKSKTFVVKVADPIETLIGELQNERRMSLAYLGGDATLGREGMDAQRAHTDQAVAVFRQDAGDASLDGVITMPARNRMRDLAARLADLTGLRFAVDNRAIDRPDALARFSVLVDVATGIDDPAYPGTAELTKEAMTLLGLRQAREILSREDALLTGALAGGEHLTAADHERFAELVAAHRLLYAKAAQTLPDADRVRYEQLVASAGFARFQATEDRLVQTQGADRHSPVDKGTWHMRSEPALRQLIGLEKQVGTGTVKRASAHAVGVLARLALAGGVGLLAIIAAIVIAFRIGSRLIRESRTMSAAVRTFAQDRLPEITALARQGERPDADVGEPEADFTVREISQIYEAFVTARQAIVTATVGEATARKGLSDVFVSLARRSQTLLHRQLTLLDGMERRAEQSAELRNLFQLDHLATRMRRHAEGLVILSGRPAGRIWRMPVPLIDVVRGAASEVEDYPRVRVLPMPEAALSGQAVADVIHLLAELIENATLYSPPEADVQVSGHTVVNGFAIEIEDRGLGMSPEMLAEANERLTEAPDFDMSDSSRLGLFVVARLAQRHEIRVALKASPFGGIRTIVLVPTALIVAAGTDRAKAESGEVAAAPELVLEPHQQPVPPDVPVPASIPAVSSSARAVRPVDSAARSAGPVLAASTPLQPVPPADPGARPEPGSLVNGDAELPRRQRQASLVSQLRQTAAGGRAGSNAAPGQVPSDRPPETARSMGAALQGGWRRGRDQAAKGEPPSAETTPPGQTAGSTAGDDDG